MNTLALKLPYMPQAPITWLEGYLKKDMRVFEWGSGGSTLFIAERVQSLVSVEYSRRWYATVLWHLVKNGIFNCRLKLIRPEFEGDQVYRSSGKYSHLYFKRFVESIDKYPDESFDLIVIDGRCRSQCILRARRKVKKGGYILVDDADRPEYAPSIDVLLEFTKAQCDRVVLLQRPGKGSAT